MRPVRVGYVPLSDAAVLVAARERGFAAAEGIDLTLVRETSWANIRDKLIYGLFDAAHMLGPMAIATTLGLGHPAAALIAPVVLSRGGNAVTVSNGLAERLAAFDGLAGGLSAAAAALRQVAGGQTEPLAFGTVFPFSTHSYLLRRLLREADLEPDRDVRLTVVPPPFAVEALRRGMVDGFCVGSPWNSVAVDSGLGTILLLGNEIAPLAPEKVLAAQAAAVDAPWFQPLLRAVAAAGDWCADPANRATLAQLLAAEAVLDLPATLIQRTLDGTMVLDAGGRTRRDPSFLVLGGSSIAAPDAQTVEWWLSAMTAADHLSAEQSATARRVFCPGLLAAALCR